MPHFRPALLVEAAPGVELDRRGEGKFDPHPAALGKQGKHDLVDAGRELEHGHEKQRHRKRRGEDDTVAQACELRLAGRLFAVFLRRFAG